MSNITNNSLKKYYRQKINKVIEHILSVVVENLDLSLGSWIAPVFLSLAFCLYTLWSPEIVFCLCIILLCISYFVLIEYFFKKYREYFIIEIFNIIFSLPLIPVIFVGMSYSSIGAAICLLLYMILAPILYAYRYCFVNNYEETLILVHKSGKIVEHKFNTSYPALEVIEGYPAYKYRLPEASDIGKIQEFVNKER